ncbi:MULTISPECIES: spondin domain-containing protein [Alteromonadaceae]|uniref:spondin domain-containing protein n=1 Tax=Alteromonadaceae TaxID=72275 RepID=UPI001C090C9A|nr:MULTISPECIES: spondin domain-containing protein [Aliiglaciecola]MBU2878809.1 spondin domain-containing protein [Aliiglaciecola lipolytica]MDO6711293.1 spondin domain-containing protein [Aliiglaciecola sp. 2_MG-2023]MDO6752258.1 spondin domain-containing protein [Aliiglaciecola sp. 1_MG-2023]
MKTSTKMLTASLLTVAMQPAWSADLTVEIQNLTQGIYFTPLLVAAHTPEASLFELGETASAEIEAMAEMGSLDGLMSIGTSVNANMVADPAGGLLAPSLSISTALTTDDSNTVLSITGMILPSNDGFVGLDNWPIPSEAGTYTFYLNAYDAGTEANDELRTSMPVPPPLDPLLGSNGSGVTSEESNSTVHVHRGNIGDAETDGGTSDIVNSIHRWLNPVAKVTVTVN